MDDEPPIDLSNLVPTDPNDQAKPAIRRFRIRAVAAVLAAILVAVGVVVAVVEVTEDTIAQDDYFIYTTPEWLTQWGAENCSTPTYKVGEAKIILLAVARNRGSEPPDSWPEDFGPATGWVFHFVVWPDEEYSKRESSWEGARIVPVEPEGSPGHVVGQHGWTWAQVYPSIPWPAAGQVTMQIEGVDGVTHRFEVDLDEVLCHHDPRNGAYIGPSTQREEQATPFGVRVRAFWPPASRSSVWKWG